MCVVYVCPPMTLLFCIVLNYIFDRCPTTQCSLCMRAQLSSIYCSLHCYAPHAHACTYFDSHHSMHVLRCVHVLDMCVRVRTHAHGHARCYALASIVLCQANTISHTQCMQKCKFCLHDRLHAGRNRLQRLGLRWGRFCKLSSKKIRYLQNRCLKGSSIHCQL